MKYIATLFALLSASLICAHAARMRGKNTKLVQRTEGSFEDKAYNSFCEYESQEDKKACKQSFCGVDGNADLTNEASRSDTNPVDIEDVDSLRLKLRNCGAPCVSSSGSIIKNMGPVPYYGCAEKDGFEDESSRVDCLRRRFNAHCGNITITQNALNDCGVTYNECSSKEHAGDELRCLRRIYNTKCLFCFIQGYTPDDCKFHQSHDQFCHNLNCRGTEVANFDFKNCAKYKSIPTAFCDDFPQEKMMKQCNEFAYLIGYEAGGVPPPMGSSDATSHGNDTFYGDSTGDNEQMKNFTGLIKTALSRWKSCRYPETCDAQCLQRKYLICADQNIRIHALEAHNYPALYYSDAYPQ